MELSKVRAREEIIAKFHDGQIIAIGGQTNQYMPDRLIDCVLESGARHLTIYSIDSSDPGHGVSLPGVGEKLALSLLSGAHNTLFPKVVELMRAKGLNDVLVIGGGVIPDTDIPGLKAAGVAEVFTPGTPTGNIVDFINANTH